MSSSENIENIENIETLESLEAPKRRSRGRPKLTIDTTLPDENPVVESPPKIKRPQSDKQKENFKKALEVRKQKIEERKLAKLALNEQKQQEQLQKKTDIERKVLKKAKCIKKREILEQTALDDLPSDEDIPDFIIEKVIKKQRQKAVRAPKPVAPSPVQSPKYKFV